MQNGALDRSILFAIPADGADPQRDGPTQLYIRGAVDLPVVLGAGENYPLLCVPSRPLGEEPLPDLSGYRCIVNLITEPELNALALDNAARFVEAVRPRVLNHPDAVRASTRDRVARLLDGIDGLVVPKTVRLTDAERHDPGRAIAAAGLQFPVILRRCGTHGGKIVGCFASQSDLPDTLPEGAECFATEFVDFRSVDGLFRKHRVFFYGERIVFRHMVVSDRWNVHMGERRRFMSDRADLLAEEERLFATPEGNFSPGIRRVLRQILERMPLDFFGMDFGILPDGRAVLFEANACMNFYPFLPEPQFAFIKRCLAPAQAATRALVGLPPAAAEAPQLKPHELAV